MFFRKVLKSSYNLSYHEKISHVIKFYERNKLKNQKTFQKMLKKESKTHKKNWEENFDIFQCNLKL